MAADIIYSLEDINENGYAITKESVEKALTKVGGELAIYSFYIKDDITQKAIISPLRNDDTIPSFSIFYGSRANKYMYKDHATGDSGDWLKFVQTLFSYLKYDEVLEQVVRDLNLVDLKKYLTNPINISQEEENKMNEKLIEKARKKLDATLDNTLLIRIKKRSQLTKTDIDYWQSRYYITKEWLDYYRIYSASHVFINNGVSNFAIDIPENNPAYGYQETKDGKLTYKIYRPLHPNPRYKWMNNANKSVWQGWIQLPEKGDMVIIASSLKDAVSIRALSGIPATALSAESTMPKKSVVEILKDRFNKVYLFYDNDWEKKKNWGQLFASKLQQQFPWMINIKLKKKDVYKDFSDYIHHNRKEKAYQKLTTLLKV
jgi:hypothetical protein